MGFFPGCCPVRRASRRSIRKCWQRTGALSYRLMSFQHYPVLCKWTITNVYLSYLLWQNRWSSINISRWFDHVYGWGGTPIYRESLNASTTQWSQSNHIASICRKAQRTILFMLSILFRHPFDNSISDQRPPNCRQQKQPRKYDKCVCRMFIIWSFTQFN